MEMIVEVFRSVLEPAVTLTDYAIVVLCIFCVARLPRSASPWWRIFFITVAVAAASGGTVHGFFPNDTDPLNRGLWLVTLLALAGATLSAWRLAQAGSLFSWLWFLAFVCTVLFLSQSFLFVVLGYLPAMVFWFFRSLKHRLRAVGLGVGFLAAAVQMLKIGVHPEHFNHNATYHVIQGVGLWLLYRSVDAHS
jgi:hypothetical protein